MARKRVIYQSEALFVGDTGNQLSSQRQSGSSSSRFQSQSGPCNVILINDGGNKVATIKTIRAIRSDLGLKEAKDLCEGTPQVLLNGVSKKSAQEAIDRLQEAGAKATLETKKRTSPKTKKKYVN